ncbi:MAG: ABC transporter permease, partial [Bacteroidetes bacterium QS_1_63_11]
MAWRYLRGAEGRAGEGRGFLRFITYVSIGGVAVGVAALLLALAIVRGFS